LGPVPDKAARRDEQAAIMTAEFHSFVMRD